MFINFYVFYSTFTLSLHMLKSCCAVSVRAGLAFLGLLNRGQCHKLSGDVGFVIRFKVDGWV